MDANITDPKLRKVLEQLEPFGFEFFCFSENGAPLVKSPNEQIAEINVAIAFVNEQVTKKQSESNQSSASPEDFPSMPNMRQSKAESSMESNAESKDSSFERQSNKPKNIQPSQKKINVPRRAPIVKIKKEKIKPYGDGFDPVSFDPSDLRKAMTFIDKNSKKKNTSSSKWLAILFKKFLDEMSSDIK
ncbi:MAG: hypothetical protein Q9M91_05745 [Candidatus Dojkabacteria bacterium]|nr:hypothetical protein [Candidatus Dojkabacteria bacterium]MDQ7021302.1 hypothetical protein [Candidatus Dojkabacteria bacterium]